MKDSLKLTLITLTAIPTYAMGQGAQQRDGAGEEISRP